MRLHVTLAGLLALSLAAAPVHAQEEQGGMGLDLSGETAQPQTEESSQDPESPTESSEDAPTVDPDALGGLDLRGEISNAELLPRLVLVGMDTAERSAIRAINGWLVALVRGVRGVEQVALGTTFKEVKERLADDYVAALRCSEASCLAGPADTLDAELLVTGRLSREGKVWTVRLWTYDRDRNVVEEDVLTGRGPRDAKFMRAAAEALAHRVRGLARLRAKVKVSVNVPQAVVRAGDRTLGVGNVEARVAPGELKLTVEADEYTSFSKTLTLQPGETQTVAARLELQGPAPEGPPDEAARAVAGGPSRVPALLKRPALYTAVAGLAAVGVGMAMGLSAQSVGDRARDTDGDGVLNLTRREMLEARGKATTANILMAGGGAVVAGSAVWLLLVPTQSAPPPPSPVAGATPGASLGFHLAAGGSF